MTPKRGKTSWAPVGSLRANPWNPNVMTPFMVERACESIRQFGFVDPVLVRDVPGTRGHEIIDGEQRWRAAQSVGLDRVLVLSLGEIDDHVAKRLTIVLNETRGKFDRDGLADLVRDLLSVEDESVRAEVLSVLPYSSGEIDALLRDPPAPTADEIVSFVAGVTFKVRATSEQVAVISRAIADVRASGDALSDGSALERICADYLSGR